MESQFKSAAKPASSGHSQYASALPAILQRKCACGAAPGLSGECAECQKSYLRRGNASSIKGSAATAVLRQTPAPAEQGIGHDFSRVPIQSNMPAGRVRQSKSAGTEAMSSPDGHREYSMNGPGDAPEPAPNSPAPVKRDQAPPPKSNLNCPTDIQVSAVGPATDVDFGNNGFLTGWGGISLMEVSDPGGKTWNGTAVHESLKNIKNTCGDRGKNACSNVSSDQARSAAGSTFTVGAESNFLGKAKLPAVKNKFYDLHVFATKEASLLHELKKDSCEVQCEQSFDCGGKRFGPDFIISYTMTRDVVRAGTRKINVTRVAMNKAAVVKQAAPGSAKP
jgi:hypothetical protein